MNDYSHEFYTLIKIVYSTEKFLLEQKFTLLKRIDTHNCELNKEIATSDLRRTKLFTIAK